MDHTNTQPDGWWDSLHRAGDSMLGLIRSRFELFTVELQEEKLRAVHVIVWLALALALGVIGLLTALGTLALWLWSVAGFLGLTALIVLTLGAAATILFSIRRQIRFGPAPFADTLEEFKKDIEGFRDSR